MTLTLAGPIAPNPTPRPNHDPSATSAGPASDTGLRPPLPPPRYQAEAAEKHKAKCAEAQAQIAEFYAELKEKSAKRAAENLAAQGQYIAERDAAIQADSWDSVWSVPSPSTSAPNLSRTAALSFSPPHTHLHPHLHPHLYPHLSPHPSTYRPNRAGVRNGQPEGAGGPGGGHLAHALDSGAAQAHVSTQRRSARAASLPRQSLLRRRRDPEGYEERGVSFVDVLSGIRYGCRGASVTCVGRWASHRHGSWVIRYK